MSGVPVSQHGQSAFVHDKEISGADHTVRQIRTGAQITLLPNGVYSISDQAWTTSGKGCSVELKSLLEKDGVSPDERLAKAGGIGAVSVSVEKVRSTFNRLDGKTPVEPLDVAYTPIPTEEKFGPNPYHGDIFPKLGNPGRKELWRSQETMVELDQELAAKLYAERRNFSAKGA